MLSNRRLGRTNDEFSATRKDFPQDESQRVASLISPHFDEVAARIARGMRVSVFARRRRLKDHLFERCFFGGDFDVDVLFKGERNGGHSEDIAHDDMPAERRESPTSARHEGFFEPKECGLFASLESHFGFEESAFDGDEGEEHGAKDAIRRSDIAADFVFFDDRLATVCASRRGIDARTAQNREDEEDGDEEEPHEDGGMQNLVCMRHDFPIPNEIDENESDERHPSERKQASHHAPIARSPCRTCRNHAFKFCNLASHGRRYGHLVHRLFTDMVEVAIYNTNSGSKAMYIDSEPSTPSTWVLTRSHD